MEGHGQPTAALCGAGPAAAGAGRAGVGTPCAPARAGGSGESRILAATAGRLSGEIELVSITGASRARSSASNRRFSDGIMADQLYLSLWYPNFRLIALPAALEKVMEQFAVVSGSSRVRAAAAYPISWNEAPVYQRIYDEEHAPDAIASEAREAIAAATELLHDDFAYEFEVIWELWVPESA